jgi:hypothetical protein
MQAAGMRVSEMAQHLGVNRLRLDKWVRLEKLPERRRALEWRNRSATICATDGSKAVAMAELYCPKYGN